jgi:hypothetical protein
VRLSAMWRRPINASCQRQLWPSFPRTKNELHVSNQSV